jgi:pyridoxal phosphate enzyme (YggS family)
MSGICENLQAIRKRIDAAARKTGRTGEDIVLVVVTKTRSVAEIREALACGATDLGENYVQEAEAKYSEIGAGPRWHMIGHLQRNKVKHAVEFFDMIQSVDSEELAREIGRRAEAIGRCIDTLIEVKISSEPTKFGVDPDEVLRLADVISDIAGIRVCGLMGMAPIVAEPEATRPYFAKLKEIWDKLPREQRLYLSMGMTQDFEIAIEEGSNMVRIGTAIFGPREMSHPES